MPREWKKMMLADISVDVAYGYTESASVEKVGPRFLRITDIQNGVVNWDNVPFCPISKTNHEKYRLQSGDIVVARTGNSTGENFLFRGNEDAVFASYLIRFRINQNQADPAFVWYNLRSSQWRDFINGSKTGSAQAGANAKVLGQFSLTVPPLAEQRAIADVLGALNDKIELNRQMNETLEATTQSIFKNRFVDASTNKLPKGWSIGKLAEIADIVMGLSPNGESYNTDGVGTPLINGPVEFGDYFPVKTKWTTAPTRMTKAGDLIFCVRGSTTGRRVISDGDYCLGRGVCGIRAKNGATTFLYQTINFGLESLLTKTTGSVFPSLSAPDIKNFPVVLPPPQTVSLFNEQTEALTKKIQANITESRTLAELRDALLPKLLSGELRVP